MQEAAHSLYDSGQRLYEIHPCMRVADGNGLSGTARVLMKAPGPRGDMLLGMWRQWSRDPLLVLTQSQRDYGDVVRLRFGPKCAHLLTKPQHVQRVLLERQRFYGKNTVGWNRMRVVFGNGLLTSDGASWLSQRRVAQPAFHGERISEFGSRMSGAAHSTLERWRAAMVAGAPVDVAGDMLRLAMRVVGETLLSADVAREADEIGRALTVIFHETQQRIAKPWLLLPLPTASHRRYRSALRILDRIVLDVISKRRNGIGGERDLLAMLMAARDEESGETMNDRQLLDEVKTIFVAGIETTSTALTWTWHLLSTHPPVYARLRRELTDVLSGRAPTPADLPRLRFASCVLREAMRLYPPIWIIGRSVDEADQIDGYDLPAGSLVMLSPYATQRRSDFWINPERFDPDRFAAVDGTSLDGFAYFPFGGGPRLCIGRAFALMLAQLTLATLAVHVRPEPVPGLEVVPDPTISLRPKNGLSLLLRRPF